MNQNGEEVVVLFTASFLFFLRVRNIIYYRKRR